MEYKLDMSSNFAAIQMERKAGGQTTTRSQDGLSWEMPFGYPGAGTALLIHEPGVRDFLTASSRRVVSSWMSAPT